MLQRIPVFLGAGGLCLLLSSCSTTSNLDHVTMCQQLSANLLGEPAGIVWNQVKKIPVEQAELEIHLQFNVPGSGPQESVCFHEWELHDADAEMYSDPLDAYSKAPYKMTLNGKPVPNHQLVSASSEIIQRAGRELAEGADRAIQSGVEKVHRAVNQ